MACNSCGLSGVEGTCSMCYGDPYHNTDGEYRRWIEEEQRRQDERRQQERIQEEHMREHTGGAHG